MLSEKFKKSDSDQSTIFRIIWFLTQKNFKTLLENNNDTWFSQIKTIAKKGEKPSKDLVWTKSLFEYEFTLAGAVGDGELSATWEDDVFGYVGLAGELSATRISRSVGEE